MSRNGSGGGLARSNSDRDRRGSRKFYEAVDPHELQQDRIARVVGSTRRTVRSLAANRPVTPQDRSRGLFGVSGAERVGSGGPKPPSGGRPARPTSAFPMGRKQFLQNLSGIHSGDEGEGDRPSSVLLTGRPLRLAPLSPASPAPGCADGGDSTPGKRLSRSNSQETVTPRPPGSPSGRKRQLARPPRRASTGAQIMAMDADGPPSPSPLAGGGTPVNDDDEDDLRTPTATPPRPRPPSRSSSSGARSRISSRSNSAADYRISTAQHADSAAWQEISEVLQKLDPEGEASVLCELCDQLRGIVAVHPIRNSRRTAAVLRSLYRLLDLRNCQLLIKVIKAILVVRPSSDMPSLVQSCKYVFKLTRKEQNDTIIRGEGMASVLTELLKGRFPETTEALVYCCGAIKNLTSSDAGRKEFTSGGTIGLLSGLLEQIGAGNTATDDEASSHTSSLLVQMVSVLRNLADAKYRSLFLESKLIENLCGLFDKHGTETEFMLNSSRVLSKLTLQASCRGALAGVQHIMKTLLQLVVRHKAELPLALRLLFTMGNMTASDVDNIADLYDASQELGVLFDLLDYYVKIDAEVQSRTITEEATEEGEAALPVISESEDVLTKLVRVLANLCINPDIGPLLAAHPRVFSLVTLLERKDVDKSRDLVLNIVGAINNLSFYRIDENVMLRRRMEVSELIAPLLRNESMEVMIETARVFGNFSQDKSVRDLLRKTRADELMVILLDHDNREVVYTVCGVLMNMMGDNEGRSVLREAEGIRSLIEVLVQVGQQDWQLAAMVCKTFWNFSEGAPDANYISFFGEQESEELLVTLEQYLQLGTALEAEASLDFAIWQDEFSNVGRHLLRRLTAT